MELIGKEETKHTERSKLGEDTAERGLEEGGMETERKEEEKEREGRERVRKARRQKRERTIPTSV